MRTRNALRAAPWLAGTAVVVFTATVTLSILGRDLLGAKPAPVTQAEVRQRLAHLHGPSMMAGPTSRRHDAPGPSAVPGGKMYQGNYVYAVCDRGQATLSFSSAMDYRMIGDVPGPAAVTYVRFSAGSPETTVTVTVTCVHGAPAFKAVTGQASTAASNGAASTPSRTGTGTGTTAGTGTGTAASTPAGGAPAGTSSPPPADDGGGGRGGGGGGRGGGGSPGGSPSGSPSPEASATTSGHGRGITG